MRLYYKIILSVTEQVLHNFAIKGGGLAARRSKANKEARLMERKVCFILDASDWAHRGAQTPVQRATPLLKIMGQESV